MYSNLTDQPRPYTPAHFALDRPAPPHTTQGKTSFIRRFLGKALAGLEYVPTVGIDVVVHPYGGPGAGAGGGGGGGGGGDGAPVGVVSCCVLQYQQHSMNPAGALTHRTSSTTLSQVHLHFWDASHTELHASPSHHALLFSQVAGVFLVLDVSSRERCVPAYLGGIFRFVHDERTTVITQHTHI